MSYNPTLFVPKKLFTPLEIIDEIHKISRPLRDSLQALVGNANVSAELKKSAELNYRCVQDLHISSEELAEIYRQNRIELQNQTKLPAADPIRSSMNRSR